MGLRPTRGNDNPRRPRESGGPRQVDSRFRGNDERGSIFRGARDLIFRFAPVLRLNVSEQTGEQIG